MSARQPFVPGQGFAPSSRPESRSAHTSTASATPSLHFVADPSNPLNGGGNAQKSHSESSENAPLNIGSLTKTSNRTQNPPSRRSSLQTSNYPPRPATSDPHSSHAAASTHNPRPGTSDSHSRPNSNAVPNHRLQAHSLAKSHNIVAPTPLQARSTPSLFSNSSSFKTPALPAPRTPQKQVDFPTSTDDPMHSQTEHEPPSPDEDNADHSGFRLKTLPSQPGPHRRAFGARGVTDLTQEDEIYEIPEEEVAALNGRNKRRRSELNEDDEEDAHMAYGAPAKRFKTQKQVPERQENAYMRSPLNENENEMYHRSSSPHDLQPEYPPQQPRHHTPNRGAPPAAPRRFPPQEQYSNPNPAQPPQDTSELDRLAQLLKFDYQLDFDCAARIEKYARSAEKWKACTREEWHAGADELNGLYAKIFDFAKSHVAKKFQLFATCDGKLQGHGEVLGDRDALLEDAKDLLVAEGGNVLKK